MNTVALIPARSGSKRLLNKNIKEFFGHPLLAYAIDGAIMSGIFDGIYVSSDSEKIGKIAEYYGGQFIHCPLTIAHKDNDPDVKWITHALKEIPRSDSFAIIRPTNPFRTGETIRRAWGTWNKEYCLKAVEEVKQHPAKMWRMPEGIWWESSPYNYMMWNYLESDSHLQPIQNLEKLYIQNSSLEIRPFSKANGKDIFYQAFFTQDYEGFDINYEIDLMLAELLVNKGIVKLPEIKKEPYESTL